MSTYAIASAIEKLANNFKEVISEKNKIEKEKLALEKEKFELNKQHLNLKIKPTCNHNWQFQSSYYSESRMCHVNNYVCAYCGETKEEDFDYVNTI